MLNLKNSLFKCCELIAHSLHASLDEAVAGIAALFILHVRVALKSGRHVNFLKVSQTFSCKMLRKHVIPRIALPWSWPMLIG